MHNMEGLFITTNLRLDLNCDLINQTVAKCISLGRISSVVSFYNQTLK